MARDVWLPSLLGDRSAGGDPFRALQRHMDDVFSDWAAGGGRGLGLARDGFNPRLDVSETEKEIRIVAELPGVEEKDVEVTLVGNQLTIKGEKKNESKEEKDEKGRHYHRVERSFGMFQRALLLPDGVDAGKVGASFKGGVLTVSVPKLAETVAQAKRIEIKGS